MRGGVEKTIPPFSVLVWRFCMQIDFLPLEKRLWEDGIAQIGFSDLHGLLPERYAHLPYGVTLVFRLCSGVLDEVKTRFEPTFTYFQHYRAVNAALDNAALRTALFLERAGFLAMPVPASQSVHDMGPYSGAFQHKTAAVRAGLGWIGKSALFVSPQFGPRVRLCTVLTDCPLPGAQSAVPVSRCGGCSRCVDSCPACAITGKEYSPGMARCEIFDPEACSRHMKQAYLQIGRGAVCGICAAVCPFGKQPQKENLL